MTDEEAKLAGLKTLVGSFEVFSAHCLKIKTKTGAIVPFVWNRAQRHIHEALEKQLAETGRVRAVLLKGRQQGGSTYLGGRFYHRCSTVPGQSAFIIAHEDKATTNLFGMVKRFHEHNPLGISTGATNAKELIFDRLDGGYKLATAGTKDVGRSATVQLLHGSEFAFWANAQTHLAGIGNTVADMPGTEIVFESTANGQGNAFHLLWQNAEAGIGEYLAIFVPWFWQDEYRAPVRDDLELSSDDVALQLTYGLDREQMQWRANKIASYGAGFEWLFKQEYPCCPAEAFQTATENPLISPTSVMAAVNSRYRDELGPLIIGCDPAGDGAGSVDRTAIAFRRGRMCSRIEYHDRLNTMEVAGLLASYWNEHYPDAIFVDKGGLGAGIYDRLIELHVPVIGVNSAERARNTELYENRRAEMWWLMRDWFDEQPARVPNDAALISDVCGPQPTLASNGKRLLEKKKHMKTRGIRSPDGGDALALTFAEPVAVRDRAVYPGSNQSHRAPTSAGY